MLPKKAKMWCKKVRKHIYKGHIHPLLEFEGLEEELFWCYVKSLRYISKWIFTELIKWALILPEKSKFRILIFSLYVVHVIQAEKGDMTFYFCLHICSRNFIELVILPWERQQIMSQGLWNNIIGVLNAIVTYAARLMSHFLFIRDCFSCSSSSWCLFRGFICILHKALQKHSHCCYFC